MDGLSAEALSLLMTLAGAMSQVSQAPRRQPSTPSVSSTPVTTIDLTLHSPTNPQTPSSASSSSNPHRDEVNRQIVGRPGSVAFGVGGGDTTASPTFTSNTVERKGRKNRCNVIAQGSEDSAKTSAKKK